MSKGAGWYQDPWGGQGLRWWDGKNWTEHVQGQPGPVMSGAFAMSAGPLVRPPDTSWYHQWWFIGLMLLVCCWPAGLVLLWTRPGTPASIKGIVTVMWIVLQILLGLAFYSAFPEYYQTRV